MRFRRGLILVAALIPAICGLGCEQAPRSDQAPTPRAAHGPSAEARRPPRVVVPEEVQGAWKAVEIAIQDKTDEQEAVYEIEIGSRFEVPASDLVVEVLYFLPAFVMDGAVMTSISNKPTNPAVKVAIHEGGQEIYRGWLFSLYPATHPFFHPRYGFTLVDFIPADKEGTEKG